MVWAAHLQMLYLSSQELMLFPRLSLEEKRVSWMVGKGGNRNIGYTLSVCYFHWGMAMSLALQGHGDVTSRKHVAIQVVVTSPMLSFQACHLFSLSLYSLPYGFFSSRTTSEQNGWPFCFISLWVDDAIRNML